MSIAKNDGGMPRGWPSWNVAQEWLHCELKPIKRDNKKSSVVKNEERIKQREKK